MAKKTRSRRKIDQLDERIFRLLQVDGRKPNTEIAREVGVAEATVRKRIDRMVENQLVQVGAWAADPFAIGYRNYVIIEIQAHPSDVEQVADQLAKLPEVCFLGICTGAYNINAAAVFVSNEAMYTFMTQGLAKIPGIQKTSFANIVRVVKRKYSYPILSVDPR